MSDRDYFSDIRGEGLGGYGILGGEGVEEFGSVQTQPLSPEGVSYRIRCHNCGQPTMVVVNWHEMLYVRFGQLPPGWVYEPSKGAVRPNVGCRLCNVVVMLLFTPDDGMKTLHAGEAAGFVQPGLVQNFRAQMAQAQARQRG